MREIFSILVIIGIVVLMVIGGVGGCLNKHVIGNKQMFDFKQTFTVAYVTEGTNVVRYQITTWKDWKDSDAVQFTTADGRTIYTHLNRVLLSDR